MHTKGEENFKQTAAYVEALQNTVQQSHGTREDCSARVNGVIAQLTDPGQREPPISLGAYSEGAPAHGDPSLRVTCPSRSVVSAEIPRPLTPEAVEFYLTRPRADGLAETRLLGVAKYKDGDGKWNVTFTTERFARSSDDPLVIHAEVIGEDGRLLATHATCGVA